MNVIMVHFKFGQIPMPVPIDEVWQKLLQVNQVMGPVNPSPVESKLPFGMRRRLNPLTRLGISPTTAVIEPKLKFSDCSIRIRKDGGNSSHPNSAVAAEALFFDPSAFLFIRRGHEQKQEYSPIATNLTSSANTCATGDKQHLGAIMNTGCWLMSIADAFAHPQLPLTQNNKLKLLKCAEFFDSEALNLPRLQDEVEFVALSRSTATLMSKYPNRAMILKSRRNSSSRPLNLHVFSSNGTWKAGSERDKSAGGIVDLEPDDLVMLIRGKWPFEAVRRLAVFIQTKTTIGMDLEARIFEKVQREILSGETDGACGFDGEDGAILISKIQKFGYFDECWCGPTSSENLALRHLLHLDSRRSNLTAEPKPGPFGSTTRHYVIFRNPHFAGLHHDASKINRFRFTIDYVIRKIGNEQYINMRQDTRELFRRLSDIQYFAYVLRHVHDAKLLRVALGGGAKIVHFRQQPALEGSLFRLVKIHERPYLMQIEVERQDFLLLLSPHFTVDFIQNSFGVQDGGVTDVEKFMCSILKRSGFELSCSKLSMALFQVQ